MPHGTNPKGHSEQYIWGPKRKPIYSLKGQSRKIFRGTWYFPSELDNSHWVDMTESNCRTKLVSNVNSSLRAKVILSQKRQKKKERRLEAYLIFWSCKYVQVSISSSENNLFQLHPWFINSDPMLSLPSTLKYVEDRDYAESAWCQHALIIHTLILTQSCVSSLVSANYILVFLMIQIWSSLKNDRWISFLPSTN